MEKIFNKLVRDNIPEIILKDGWTPVTRILEDAEYKKELEDKLKEECNEVIESDSTTRIEELADVLEVVRALAKIEGKSLNDVIEVAEAKKLKRGAFDKKIYLEKNVK